MSNTNDIIPSHLNQASLAEKTVFFRTLICLAYVDGNCDESELSYITDAAQIQGIENIEELLKPQTTSELLDSLEIIKDKHLAMELIREMCTLAHVDNELSDNETLLIGEVGLKLGLTLEKIEQISNWVIDRIIWLEQAKLIFEEE